TSSVCLEDAERYFARPNDPTERWCERCSAAVLMPWDEMKRVLGREFRWSPGVVIRDVARVQKIARIFRVSIRATALRLIHHGTADWELYAKIPVASEEKRRGGGGEGRRRPQIREDHYGRRNP